MLSTILFIIVVGLLIFGFTKLDCNVYLWLLNKFCSGPSYTAHLNGSVVWITGASSGIGEYLAYEFAKKGCRLALSGTNEGRLAQVKTKCLDLNRKLSVTDIICVPFDISYYPSHQTALTQVITQFKQLDILVNNAGRSQRAAFEKIDILVDEDMFKVNVFGPVHLTRLVVNHWYNTQHKGQIAVTSSVAGICPSPYSCTYSGTKYALHGYFETLRIEGAGKIKITLLCPGPVFSRILETSYTSEPGIKFNKSHDPDSKRMSTERCAQLCLTAIINRVSVAWISIQPVLAVCYLSQYVPEVLTIVMARLYSQGKLMQIREGK